jgi:hypothetical protein
MELGKGKLRCAIDRHWWSVLRLEIRQPRDPEKGSSSKATNEMLFSSGVM